MATFIIGLVILFGGAALYGRFCEKVFGPDDRQTPAYAKQDGVDFIPMQGWKNSLINLLNIAGTGPIFGPIRYARLFLRHDLSARRRHPDAPDDQALFQ